MSEVVGEDLSVCVSEGAETQARHIASMVRRARDWTTPILGMTPTFMDPFVDAIVVHELGHLYHQQVPFEFPRLWLTELFANLVMVGYVHDLEPALLPGIEAYALAAVHASEALYPGSTLEEMNAPPEASAETYVWYQMVLIAGALALWRTVGADGLRGMHTRFRDPDLDLPTIHARLAEIDQEAIRIMDNWPHLGTLI